MALSYPETNGITEQIIGAAIEVHRHLGPGLVESVYDEALTFEVTERGLTVDCQRSIPLMYKSRRLRAVYRPDIIVNRMVIVEVKALEKTLSVHKWQVQTYLKVTGLHVGLLLNFNVAAMTEGITRISL